MTEAPVTFLGRNARDHAGESPCDGCSAPCCRMTVHPQEPPTTFEQLDYLRYAIGFEGSELAVERAGTWKLIRWSDCAHLTPDRRCGVHGTERQPKICVYFSPYGCWYKRNFHGDAAPADLIRLDLAAFERVLERVVVGPDGDLASVPDWDELVVLAGPGRGPIA